VRFLLGEMFPNDAAVRLRSAGHDAVDVGESELLGAPDADIFQRAVDDDRVLVTENVRDFAPLVGERADAGRPTVPWCSC
jgi:predicted nuclease of predicted toxin-antitoxin system